jgi:hypothetical protein
LCRFARTLGKFVLQPPLDDRHYVRQLHRAQRLAFWDAVPFCETTATARRRSMLGDEHRMTFEGRLLAVVSRVRCAQPCSYQFGRIGENGMQALPLNVSQFLRAKLEPPTEGRFCKIDEKLIDVLRGRLL